jgi:hypothetical protein
MEFEPQETAAVRDELDQECEAAVGVDVDP